MSNPPNSSGPPPPNYVMLQDGNLKPPPYRGNVPRYETKSRKSKSGCCLKCICCCYCTLFIIILILAAFTGVFFLVYEPRIPSYKVKNVEIASFDVKSDYTIQAEIIITVRAENPNNKIGIEYGDNNSIAVKFQDSELCSGKIPGFYQGHPNTTVLKVTLKGKTESGSGIHQALMRSMDEGKVPLQVIIVMPFKIIIQEYKSKWFFALVDNSLVLDSLSPQKAPKILSSDSKLRITIKPK